MEIQLLLLISIIIFFISSCYFLVRGRKSDVAYSGFVVSLVTLFSGLIMYEGVFVGVSANGDSLFYTRWLGYIASCTLLMYTMAKSLAVKKTSFVPLMYMTGLTMLSGAFASTAEGVLMLVYFLIGAIAFIEMIRLLKNNDTGLLGWTTKYIVFGWSVFPVIFIISPEGYALISTGASLVAYIVLDIFSKIIFYIEAEKRAL